MQSDFFAKERAARQRGRAAATRRELTPPRHRTPARDVALERAEERVDRRVVSRVRVCRVVRRRRQSRQSRQNGQVSPGVVPAALQKAERQLARFTQRGPVALVRRVQKRDRGELRASFCFKRSQDASTDVTCRVRRAFAVRAVGGGDGERRAVRRAAHLRGRRRRARPQTAGNRLQRLRERVYYGVRTCVRAAREPRERAERRRARPLRPLTTLLGRTGPVVPGLRTRVASRTRQLLFDPPKHFARVPREHRTPFFIRGEDAREAL